MFTGIIETIGEVVLAKKVGGDIRITIAAPDFSERDVNLGDSIALNGACMTVIAQRDDQFDFDVSVESLNHTLIGDWVAGKKINMEMALLPTTRLGGHLVSGHVDGLSTLTSLSNDARSWCMVFEVPSSLAKYVAKKGSITLNGTSLTVNTVDKNQFSVNVIPHTFEVTTLGELSEGDQVHVEVDLIARYLERLLRGDSEIKSDGISQSFLSEHGFS